MKKIVKNIILTALLLMSVFSLSIITHADPALLYAAQNGVNVYTEMDTKAPVYQTLNAGRQVIVNYISDDRQWVSIVCPDYSGEGQKEGFVQMQYMSYVMPQSACSHQWTEWVTVTQPTCNESGMRTRTCTICGVGDSQIIGVLPHSFSDWMVAKPATCTEEGDRVTRCVNCGFEQHQAIEKLTHEYDEWRTTKIATCTAEGERVHRCRLCGTEEKESIAMLAHEYDDWKTDKKATCEEEGKRSHKCKVCGHIEEEAVAKLPHDLKWEMTVKTTDHSAGTRENICSKCGYVAESETVYPEGTMKRGDRGDNVKEMQDLLVDQEYLAQGGADGIFGGGTESAVKKFQEDMKITSDGICWPQTLKKMKHDYGPWKTIKEVTRTEAGERSHKCKDCGYEQKEEIIPVPNIKSGDRSDSVKVIQQMLTGMGYDAGAYDGIYGKMLEKAYSDFAKDNDLEYKEGVISAEIIDAIVNKWIESVPAEKWNTTDDDEIEIALKMERKESSDKKTAEYTWTVSNLGDEKCYFAAILMSDKINPDFKKDIYAMAVNGTELLSDAENKAEGSYVAESFENTSAVALVVSAKDGSVRISNIKTFE